MARFTTKKMQNKMLPFVIPVALLLGLSSPAAGLLSVIAERYADAGSPAPEEE